MALTTAFDSIKPNSSIKYNKLSNEYLFSVPTRVEKSVLKKKIKKGLDICTQREPLIYELTMDTEIK